MLIGYCFCWKNYLLHLEDFIWKVLFEFMAIFFVPSFSNILRLEWIFFPFCRIILKEKFIYGNKIPYLLMYKVALGLRNYWSLMTT